MVKVGQFGHVTELKLKKNVDFGGWTSIFLGLDTKRKYGPLKPKAMPKQFKIKQIEK